MFSVMENVCHSIKNGGRTSALSLHGGGGKYFFWLLEICIISMIYTQWSRQVSLLIIPFCNDALLHPLDAFICLVTAKKMHRKSDKQYRQWTPFSFCFCLCGSKKYFRASVSQITSQSGPVVKIHSYASPPGIRTNGSSHINMIKYSPS